MEIEEFYNKNFADITSFDDFDREFEIRCLEDDNFAKRVSEKFVEKIERYKKIVEEFIHADGSNIAVLNEIKEMSDSYKDKMNKTYKELVIIERSFTICDLENDEQGFISFVKEGYAKWSSIKSEILDIIKKAKESWKNTSKVKEELGYLG